MKKNKYPGKFIVIDGPNGSGKSSLIKKLVKELKKLGKDVAVTKEISSSKIGIFAREMMPEGCHASPVLQDRAGSTF